MLAFGVSDYDDDTLDLAYPEKDVDDLVAGRLGKTRLSDLEVEIEELARSR